MRAIRCGIRLCFETIGSEEVLLEEFAATQGLMWTVHVTNSRNITIRNLNIRTTTGNGDGIDVDSCQHVRIDGCLDFFDEHLRGRNIKRSFDRFPSEAELEAAAPAR